MRYTKLMLVWIATLFSVSSALSADQYTIDPVHSSIGFSVRHMMVSNVKGKFKDVSGTIVYDAADITKSSVNVTIKTASISTDNDQRDNHLRSPDFFDAANNPDITFQSKRIEKKGTGYVAVGTLTMRGVPKEVSMPFAILGTVKDQRGRGRLGVEASLTINRMDYGISYSRALDSGGLVVSNEVKIELNVEAVQS